MPFEAHVMEDTTRLPHLHLPTTPRLAAPFFQVKHMELGDSAIAAPGIMFYLHLPETYHIPNDIEGVGAIEHEFAQAGSEDDKMCLQYVLHGMTGSAEAVGCKRKWCATRLRSNAYVRRASVFFLC